VKQVSSEERPVAEEVRKVAEEILKTIEEAMKKMEEWRIEEAEKDVAELEALRRDLMSWLNGEIDRFYMKMHYRLYPSTPKAIYVTIYGNSGYIVTYEDPETTKDTYKIVDRLFSDFNVLKKLLTSLASKAVDVGERIALVYARYRNLKENYEELKGRVGELEERIRELEEGEEEEDC